MTWARATCLLALVAGCGDNLPADGFRGGSRLRAVFLSDGDGARQFETFHDPWLGADCSFQADPLRCLPDVAHVDTYLDADCSEPVFARGVTDTCVPPPTHFGLAIDDACSSEPRDFQRIWKRGERVTPELVYAFEEEGCVARWARTDYDYYAAELELPIEAFVTGQRLLALPGVHRLRDVVVVGDDGSEQPIGYFDDVLAAECSLDSRSGLCVPEMVPTPFYSNPTCTWPLATWTAGACDALPDFVGRYAADGALEIYERGEPFVPVLSYYMAFDGSCRWTYPSAEVEYFRKGDSVLDDLVAAEEVLTGTGRLGAYRDGGFHDRDLGAHCAPTLTGPDQWHCLPDLAPNATTFFADPYCEQQVFVFEQDQSAPWKATRGLVSRPTSDGCEQHTRVYRVGSEIDSGNLYERRFLGCGRVSWNRAEVRYYAIGDEVSLGEYVRLHRVTD